MGKKRSNGGFTPHYEMPGTFTEPAGDGLAAFGFPDLPGVRVNAVDPAVSEKQRRFAGAELARKRAGKRTRSGMTETQLEEFARKPRK